MATVEIKTADPRMAAAIAEGANAVKLREIQQQYARLQAKDGVRTEGDERRWQRTRRRLARKYTTKPMNPLSGAILTVWGTLWLGLYNLAEYLSEYREG